MSIRAKRCAVLALLTVFCIGQYTNVSAGKIADYAALSGEGRYAEALDVARKIVKRPNIVGRITKDEEYLLNVQAIGLKALGDYSLYIGTASNIELNDEANRYYRKGLEYAGENLYL